MKVKCINIKYDRYNYKSYLTIGKTYNVIREDDYWYWTIDDDGDERGYPKEWFKPLSEIRNETINKLLEDES